MIKEKIIVGNKMKHEILGEVKHERLWVKNYTLEFYSNSEEGVMLIDGEVDKEIEKLQIDAIKLFEGNLTSILEEAKSKLYTYYLENIEEYREMYGEYADECAPKITDSKDMSALLEFEAVYVPYQFDENRLEIGILFESKFEIEHGIAIKILNGKVEEVGYKDILL